MTEPVRVLHVDDEPDFAEMAATFLERAEDRLVVETATCADEGFDMLTDGRYDCVVSDYDMPGKNGIEFLESVREDYPDLPFILFTGKGSEEVASDAISTGVTDYLQKQGGTDQYMILAKRIENAVMKHRSERALKQSRERLSLFFEQSPLGAIQWDEEFRFERLNERAEEILGYSEAELRGESWEVIVAEEDHEPVGEVVAQLLDAEGGTHSVNKNVRKDGRTIACEWHNRAVTDEDGDVRAIFSKFRDITDRKEREEELRTKNQAMDEAPVGIVITDPGQDDNPIVYANESFKEMTGYDDEKILGRNCRFLQGEKTEEEPVRRMREAIDACKSVTVTLRNYTKDGEMFWNRVSIAPLYDDEGEVTNFVGFQEDVTELKENEEQLEHYREYTDSILDASDDLFFVCGEEGSLQRWNERLNEVTGYTDEEAASMNALDFVPEEHRERSGEKMAEVFEEGSARLEVPVLTKEGSSVPYEFTADCVENPDGEPHLVAIGRNVTERKEHEKKLEKQNERLEEFASVVSHDLRSPLSVAKGRLELAQEECDNEHLDRVAEAHDRMETLIDNVLSLARDEKPADITEPIELGEFVEECWQSVDTEGATLVIDFGRATTVQADRSRLRQLLENLMRNAVEHGSTGNRPGSDDSVVHESTSEPTDGGVTVTVGKLGDGKGFYVADDGSGIPKEERQRVFESGYSASEKGTGLGLSIVREIAEAHGWEVNVTESEDGGARLEVTGVGFADT